MSLTAAAFVLSVTMVVPEDVTPEVLLVEKYDNMTQCAFMIGGYAGVIHEKGFMGKVMVPYADDETEEGNRRVWTMFEHTGHPGSVFILECQRDDENI